ncbi:methyl-accepting chemotaxis protein [Paenibacillus sanfengchensis]|uniref:methyl-accepting chemotaxis protein n=1 Tax=Paenibacillus sanfengchensis TaxID=3119819 RepID=UPI002FE1F814
MKFGRFLQFKSVGMKLFVMVFGVIMILSAILGLSSYVMSKEIIRGQVGSAASQAIEQAADKLDFLFSGYESISRQMAVDQILKEDLETVTRQDVDIIRKTEAETRIKNKLNAMKGSDERLIGIRLVNKDFSNNYATSGASGTQRNDGVESRIAAIAQAAGKPVWIPGLKKGFFDTSNEPTITMGRVLKNLNHPEAEFVLLIEIKSAALTETLANLKLGDSGQTNVLTPDNTIVHASRPELIETKSALDLAEAQFSGSSASFAASDEHGIRQLVVYKQLETAPWRLIGYAPESDFLSAADKLLYVSLFVMGLAIMVALGIGYYLFRNVGKPLQKLSRLMEEGERGNLKVRANFKGRDEIGRLGQSFNKMLEQISWLVERIQRSTQELWLTADTLAQASRNTATTAGEIAAATEEIAQGSSSLAEEAEKGNSLTDEIGMKMAQVIHLTELMDTSAGRIVQVSEQGQENMGRLVEKTEDVSRMTARVEENSGKLSQITLSIRGILQPMIEMTRQTQILSLNATIEASRAGAAGKGFSVIAEQIRKLSVQSNDSIRNVSAMTEEIQSAIENTVNVLQEITPKFREQLESVTSASSIFRGVGREMDGFARELQSASASVGELMGAQLALRDFVANVSSVVQQSGASTEEVASMASGQYRVSEELVGLSRRLKELSESLKQSLNVFELNSGEQADSKDEAE